MGVVSLYISLPSGGHPEVSKLYMYICNSNLPSGKSLAGTISISQKMLSIGTTLWVSDMFSDITQIEPRIICCCGKVSNGNVGIGNLQATVT